MPCTNTVLRARFAPLRARAADPPAQRLPPPNPTHPDRNLARTLRKRRRATRHKENMGAARALRSAPRARSHTWYHQASPYAPPRCRAARTTLHGMLAHRRPKQQGLRARYAPLRARAAIPGTTRHLAIPPKTATHLHSARKTQHHPAQSRIPPAQQPFVGQQHCSPQARITDAIAHRASAHPLAPRPPAREICSHVADVTAERGPPSLLNPS
jgi:hypothetical protein